MNRIVSIDILRGLVMILMTLDHTRDFFSNAHFSPTNLDKTTVALFLTRWITHFCAPVFVFLAGTSAYLWQSRRGNTAALDQFLLKRGLLILIITCTAEAWAWDFLHDWRHVYGGVLWAIGWSMLVLAVLTKLPLMVVVGLGGLLILGHNAFDGLTAAQLGWFGPWWAILHSGEKIEFLQGWQLSPHYPLIPWIGVMAMGYGFGHWLSHPVARNKKQLLWLGGSLIAAFLLLRAANWYGDPKPWQQFPDPVFTWLSFLNCHKYPPSLLYLLMTLGPAIIVLGLLTGCSVRQFAAVQVFGRTPLFFYITHLYLIHLIAVLIQLGQGGDVAALLHGGIWEPALPADYGYSLPVVYGFWGLMLLLLYPLCRGFESLKTRKPQWVWLKYL